MRWLVTGSGGQLGGHITRQLVTRGHDVLGTVRPASPPLGFADCEPIDLRDQEAVARLLDRWAPTHIVHCASVSVPRDADRAAADSHALEETLLRTLADRAAAGGAWLMQSSTDFVFGGTDGSWHRETDTPAPVNPYGMRKAAGERLLLEREAGTVARFSWLYGEPVVPRPSTYLRSLEQLAAGEVLTLIDDEYRTPAALTDAAHAVVELGLRRHQGIVHVGGPDRLTPLQFWQRVADGLGTELRARPIPRLSLGPRPHDVSLDSSLLGTLLPGFAMSAVPGPAQRTDRAPGTDARVPRP